MNENISNAKTIITEDSNNENFEYTFIPVLK